MLSKSFTSNLARTTNEEFRHKQVLESLSQAGEDNKLIMKNDSDDDNFTDVPKLSDYGSALVFSKKDRNSTENNKHSRCSDEHSESFSTNTSFPTAKVDVENISNSYNLEKFKSLQQSYKDEVATKQLERRKTRRLFNRSRFSLLGPAQRTDLSSNKAEVALDRSTSDVATNYKTVTDPAYALTPALTTVLKPALALTSDTALRTTSSPALRSVSTPEWVLSEEKSKSTQLTSQKMNELPNNNTTSDMEKQHNLLKVSEIDYHSIDFGDLNPVQYIKKHNLPTTELPKISKVYFEKQRLRSKEIALKNHLMSRDKYSTLQASLNYNENASSWSQPTAPTRSSESDEFAELSNKLKLTQSKSYSKLEDVHYKQTYKREALSSIDVNRNSPYGIKHQKKTRLATYNDHGEARSLYQNLNQVENNENEEIPSYQFVKEHVENIKPSKKVEIIEPKLSGSMNNKSTKNVIAVNSSEYEKIELLGRGGSSKVYKVRNCNNNKIYALKRVIFDEFDESSVEGFKGEIDLLKKLENQKRVVKLIDYKMNSGLLFLVMECGDHDLSQILNQRSNLPLDIEFVRFYAREMMTCVKVVHDAGIVHSDLKPANFVLVKGILKIIDFGIANAVPDHTVNIYRETQIGTPNYMAPEALVAMNNQNESDIQNKWKVGKPSDIWSCGCILYQMIYGKPPYGGYQGQNRLLAIMNPNVKIIFSEKTAKNERVPRSALETMKACLARNPEKRWSVQKVLNGIFINPVMITPFIVKNLIENAVHYGIEQKQVSDEKISELADDVLSRLSEFRV